MTFGRPSPEENRARRDAEKEANPRSLGAGPRPLHRGTYDGGVSGTPVPKDETVQSEAYRRLVAIFPCKNCGIAGISQAAHPNTGKATGKKLIDDRLCFPLCADTPNRVGCHTRFDQHALLDKATRRAIEPVWGADTRRRINAAGLWPEGLPQYPDEPTQGDAP